MSVVRIGAGPGDPDLLTTRARDVIGQATRIVVSEATLLRLARAVAPLGVLVELGAPPPVGPGPLVVHLVAGDGLAGPPVDDVVAGVPGDADRRALDVLTDVGRARPLLGLSVVVTRAADQAGELARPLRRLGADVVELPTIRIDPAADGGRALTDALSQVDRYQWLVVTSTNGARAVLDRLPDGRRLAGVNLAAIGPATAAALAVAHLPPDLVPPRFVAESLLDVFPGGPGRVLLARAAVARDALPQGLAARGWQVDVVEAYRTAIASADPDVLDAVAAADVACFTAPSTFERFLELAGRNRLPPHLACIGPVTAAALRRAGCAPAVEATIHTMAGLVEALVEWAAARQPGRA